MIFADRGTAPCLGFVSEAGTGVRPYKHYILNAHSRTASGCTHFLTP
jgi:hypothetical protein